MKITELEKRLVELERKVAAMSAPSEQKKPAGINAWVNEIRGTFEDNEAYREAARLGREWRRSQGIDGKKPSRKGKTA